MPAGAARGEEHSLRLALADAGNLSGIGSAGGTLDSVLLQGLFVPLTCPFYRDGASYLRKLEHNVGRYSLGPAAGLVALPPGGESGALTDAEAHSVLQAVGATAGNDKVLLAGVERASVSSALEFASAAASAHFDAIVLAPPPDWARLVHGGDARELVVFYEAVADRSPLPVVLWSDGTPPSLQLPVEVVAALARHSNVLGVLDADLVADRLAAILAATEDVRREVTVTNVFAAVTQRMLQPAATPGGGAGFVSLEALRGGTAVVSALPATALATPLVPANALKTRTKQVGFQVLSAAPAHSLVPLLVAGATGAMPSLATCAPQACFEAYAAWKDGDLALAAERAERLRGAEDLISPLGPAAVKTGCDFNGYFGGVPRLPRLPLNAETRSAVESALRDIRN